MSYYPSGNNQSNSFTFLIALGLVLVGLFSLNTSLQFVPLEFDAANPTYLTVVGILCILGGVFLFLQSRVHRRYY
ncbi:MAG TPA: hypothetical protein VJG90_03990 [Candidatus Nanoarchaeia archaeon]|nr:hypothetical protein [Candidatus Nanoarchaeia archaeon]